MSSQDEQKNESLQLLQILHAVVKPSDPSRDRLLREMAHIKNGIEHWPVTKENWQVLCKKLQIHLTLSQCKKILSRLPLQEQKLAEEVRKRVLKIRR